MKSLVQASVVLLILVLAGGLSVQFGIFSAGQIRSALEFATVAMIAMLAFLSF